MRRSLRRDVQRRASGRCEYCHMPDAYDQLPFHVDHVVARQHRGRSTSSNLAWTCSRCNAHKGPNLSGVDPLTRSVVPLFNPRRDRWHEHFAWSGAKAVGLTPIGRATVQTLAMNGRLVLMKRRQLLAEGVFEA